MAFSSRILSRSKQLFGSEIILQQKYAVPVRSFAKGTATAPASARKGDQMLKNTYLDVKKKFETAIGILKQEKITIDPEDTAAVKKYASVMQLIREKAGLVSEAERVQNDIMAATQDIPDAKTYLLAVKEIRIKKGLVDNLGAEAMMMNALEKIEKQIKKPLMRNDESNMTLLRAEFDNINKKLGIRKEDLPKYEAQAELAIAKAQLEELKKDAAEAMETQMKKEEFKDEERVDVKSLDMRNFL